MNQKQKEGRSGEEIAAQYLEAQGYKIILRNFRCYKGEIDIIAKQKETLIFIEVKTRTSIKYGEAKEAVDAKKKKHIYESAKYYLYKTKQGESYTRIDVIEVYINNRKCRNKTYKRSNVRNIVPKTIDEICKKVYYISHRVKNK